MKKTISTLLSLLLIPMLVFSCIGDAYAVSNFTTKSPFNGKTYTHYGVYAEASINHMIDVSEHNGLINFYKIKAIGIDDVIIRVGFRGYGSSGSIGEDIYFYDNIENAIDAGLNVGLYFYSQSLTEAEAKTEAEFCIKRAALYKEYINLPIFFDYEFAGVSTGRLDKAWSNGTLNKTKMTANTIAFCEAVKSAGYAPGVYASASFYTDQLNASKLTSKGYEIWNAYYTTNSTAGSYWTNKNPVYAYWQYSSSPNVQGCCGDPSSAWLKVKYNGKTGYILSSYVDFIDATSGFSIADGLNLRKGAGTSYDVITQIPFAGVVTILSYPTSTRADTNFHYIFKGIDKPVFTLSTDGKNVNVRWKEVSGAAYYRVLSYNTSTKKYTRWTQTTELTYTKSNVSVGDKYNLLVRAYLPSGAGSDYSTADLKTIEIKPDKPAFTLSAGTSCVHIQWSKVASATSYGIYSYNGKLQKLGEVNGTSFDVENLDKCTEYTFLVRAFAKNGVVSTYKKSDMQSIVTAPESPVLSCTESTTESLKLSWKKVQGAAFYRLYSLNEKSGKYVRVAETKNATYLLKDLQSGTDYTILVHAFSAAKSWSDTVEGSVVHASTLPEQPRLRLTAYSDSVKLHWNSVNGAAYYRVSMYDSATKKFIKLAQTENTSWVHTDCKPKTKYTYVVRAIKDKNTVSVITKEDRQSIQTLIAKPRFKVAIADETTVNITWNKVSDAAYYRVYLYNPTTKKGTKIARTKSLAYQYTKAGIGNEYTFLVRAFDSAGVGSSYTAAERKSVSFVLQKPVFTLESTEKGSVNITWKKTALAAYYRVYTFNAESGKYTKIAQVKNLAYTVTGLESGKDYTFLVKAFTESGKSAVYDKADNRSIQVL